ncbi:MADS-box protein JOINTLESS [Iris pallida]|uniref:MADS-box protein JOINTLESS n=1 Tax=Iris pallida TaxID=29817 RepID=A0AAX6FHQ7_IRIPA|nr:MADS-box protein JOINTLESS [Iris pallida]
MAREKIQIRKIDNATARQVTFSKRRRGLFKKAEELAVLCDAEVGIVIFSANGKLFEYASSSMKDIIEKRSMHSKKILLDKPSLDLNLDNCNFESLRKTVTEETQQLRKTRGEDLKGLSIEELQQLEKTLEAGLDRVLEKKGDKIKERISGLEKKGLQLKEENTRLRQQMELDMSTVGKQVVTDPENGLYEDGQSSESVTNASHSGGPQDYDDSFDTSLKLGLPWKESNATMMQ